MKGVIKKILRPLIPFLYDEFKRQERVKADQRKRELFTSLQSVGFGCRLNGEKWVITNPKKVLLGNNIHVGDNAYLDTRGGLTIGDNTHISRNVTIYTVNHRYEGKALPYDLQLIQKPVQIGENVWIGMNVSIIPGVKIGKGAIIGLGTVVTRDIEDYEIVGSQPTKNLKYRSLKKYQALNDISAFGGVNGRLVKESDIAGYKTTYANNREKSIVFILSTGRSGSHAITNMLNQHSQCRAYHEDMRQLIALSTQLAHENLTKEEAYKTLEILFQHKFWEPSDQLIIHSDQKLWNFIPFLAEYFPNAKFIHLIREPVSCIRSMVLRNWYRPDEYEKCNTYEWSLFRLRGDKIGQTDAQSWLGLTNIEKCAWYYFFTNATIHRELKNFNPKRHLQLKLEELPENRNKIIQFLDLKNEDLKVDVTNTVRDGDKKNYQFLDEEALHQAVIRFSSIYSAPYQN